METKAVEMAVEMDGRERKTVLKEKVLCCKLSEPNGVRGSENGGFTNMSELIFVIFKSLANPALLKGSTFV